MEARIKKGNNVMMKNILKLKHDNSWAVQNEAIKQEMEIKDVDLESSKYSTSKLLRQKAYKLH